MPKSMFVAAGISMMAAYAMPSMAHHSFSMYDMTKTITVQGEVTQFVWQAPHSHIHVRVPPIAGKPGSGGDFDIEGPAPNILVRQGWNKLSVKAGDRVTLTAHPMRMNEKAGALIYAVLKGVTMYPDAKRPAVATQAAPGNTAGH